MIVFPPSRRHMQVQRLKRPDDPSSVAENLWTEEFTACRFSLLIDEPKDVEHLLADTGVGFIRDVKQVVGQLVGGPSQGHIEKVGFQIGVFVASDLDADTPFAVAIGDQA